jgi:peptidoglycan hydrolase CwlO-like protein
MKSNLRVVSLLALLGAGVVMAQAAKPTTAAPTQEQMEKAKAAMMEDRKQMMSEAKTVDSDASAIMASVKASKSAEMKALEAQVSKLQSDIKILTAHLAQQPRYFDMPGDSKLRP